MKPKEVQLSKRARVHFSPILGNMFLVLKQHSFELQKVNCHMYVESQKVFLQNWLIKIQKGLMLRHLYLN